MRDDIKLIDPTRLELTMLATKASETIQFGASGAIQSGNCSVVATTAEELAEHAEELAELDLMNPGFLRFCRALLDLAAREPDLDTAGLRCHLSEQGFSAILAEIQRPDLFVHGRFARPGCGVEEARTGVQDVLRTYRKQRVAMETEEAVRILAESPTEDNLVRLEAKKRLLQDEEDAGDRSGAAVPEET